MKKSIFVVLVIAGLSLIHIQSLSAQEETVASKAFYSELGGPGLIMSANFDSRFNSNERLGLGFRLGIGFAYQEGSSYYWDDYTYRMRTYYSIPAGLNYVLGKPNSAHTFEVGAGLTFLTRKVALFYFDEEKPGNVIGFFTFMYRRVPVNGGFSFRVGLTPMIGTSGDLFPMGAVGFGYAF